MNENAGPYAGLDRFEARATRRRRPREGRLPGRERRTTRCRSANAIAARPSSSRASRRSGSSKIRPLADRAIEAVEHGEIKFVPEKYAKTYLEWMRNIHDWCISRQLWWGHRIPAWHCTCGEIIVARETPAKCKCGSARSSRTPTYSTPGSRPDCCRARAGLAGKDAGPRSFLSHDAADYRLRHPVLLGGAHDHDELPLHARPPQTRIRTLVGTKNDIPFRRSTFTAWCATPNARRCRRPRAT